MSNFIHDHHTLVGYIGLLVGHGTLLVILSVKTKKYRNEAK